MTFGTLPLFSEAMHGIGKTLPKMASGRRMADDDVTALGSYGLSDMAPSVTGSLDSDNSGYNGFGIDMISVTNA